MKKYKLQTKVRIKNPYKNIMKKSQEHRTFPNTLNRQFNNKIPIGILIYANLLMFYATFII